MGILLLLKFALLCIDHLAWPVIALGYPLFASIRAVETDSKSHMKKLIIYWTLFSLISLFEFAFLKVIVWIPFWDSIRLISIIWLVIPGFQGACHAYQVLVRPVLCVDLQAVIHKLCNTKEDKRLMSPTFLDVAEQYIKENGSEALERLIATKKECIKSERDILVLEPEKKNDLATSEQMHYAETKPPDTSDRPPETPLIKNSKQEWTCDLCKVTTTSERTLNAHLQGSKHRSKCESLKGSMFHAEDARTSPSRSNQESPQKQAQPKQDIETTLPDTSDSPPEAPFINKSKQEWTCNLCKVTTTSETTLNAHLQGAKHRSNYESLKGRKFHAGDTRPSSSSSNQGTGQKQAKPKQGGGTNQALNLYCNACSLKLRNDHDLASHIRGKQHMSNVATILSGGNK